MWVDFSLARPDLSTTASGGSAVIAVQQAVSEAAAMALGRLEAGADVLPTQLALETVNRCNARCRMCPGSSLTRPRGSMDRERHRLIVDRVAAWGPPITCVSHAGMGEPLLDRDLAEKISYEKQTFPKADVVVYTNGTLLDERRGEELIACGADMVSVSLNAFDPAVYTAITGLDRDRTYARVEEFFARARSAGGTTRTQVSLVPSPHSPLPDRKAFIAYWTDRGVSVAVPPLIHWGAGQAGNGPEGPVACLYLWKVLMVDWDGTVKPCCEDYDSSLVLGRLPQDDPRVVFNSPVMRCLRQRHLQGDFSRPAMCAACAETGSPARDYWSLESPVFTPDVSDTVETFKVELGQKLAASIAHNTFDYPPYVWPPSTPARSYIERFLSTYADQVRGQVVEFHPGYYRRFFPGADHYAVWNIEPAPDVTVVADIQNATSVADASFDVVVCTHVLSAVRDVWAAGRELWRVLAPGGLLLCTVPCLLQGYAPDPRDYWRFTRDSLDAIFARFPERHIHAYGNPATAAGSLHYLMTNHFPPNVMAHDDARCPSILGLAARKY
uniref:Putative Fe-S oxidoreductase n=1 Tax=Desulfovibrio sp. U5L TaxID=596152 RepID=I2Q7L7_9BACT